MRILLISPLGFPINRQTRYAGIEQLVYNYSRELCKTHDVTVMGHAKSIFPPEVKVLPYDVQPGEDIYLSAELKHYQMCQSKLCTFDIIHDFSHAHLASRFNVNLPSLNIFWHAPNEVQYPKAPYNIVGLSSWACREFERYYHQKARYQQSIALDTDTYKLSNKHRGDRFLTIGRMAKEKGNLDAVIFCREVGVPLDVCGADSNQEYKNQILSLCDGQQVRYLGEVDDITKIKLYQTCKALIYATDRPEVTSHKILEAMLCGASVIVPSIGALPEIVTHGVNGFLCRNKDEFVKAIKLVLLLEPKKRYDWVKKTYSIDTVVSDYIPLYKKVKEGLRW